MVYSQAKAWENFNDQKAADNFPRWPNEVMLKLVFGNYLKDKITLPAGARILDVGCGFGNNLLPFLAKGYECFGTEITKQMADQTRRILETRGFHAQIKEGTNRRLPFDDRSFDLLLSIHVVHYEESRENIRAAFLEYARVLKDEGRLILMTVGPKHAILKEAQKSALHVYQIHNYDFRDGSLFYCFDAQNHLKECLEDSFEAVETGRVTESLMEVNLDFFIASAKVRRPS